jgi:SpoVK/Ycf46/Vps4 family AAA+-type ATPase
MEDSTQMINSLKEALELSPDNLPLRRHLADILLGSGRADEAETEFRKVLSHSPADKQAMTGLVKSYRDQQKYKAALLVLEQLRDSGPVNQDVEKLHIELLIGDGQLEAASRSYQSAKMDNPSLSFPELDAMNGGLLTDTPQSTPDFVIDGMMRQTERDELDDFLSELEKPSITFDDVGGMEQVKEDIHMKIIMPLTNKDLYEAYGKKAGGGILLYGPPGCGKTHLARATAGQVNARFISVGLNDVLDMWIGQSEQKLHQIFEQARRNTPCVLFFDEVDALGASRTDLKQSGGRHLINQFLSELDGIDADNEGILILAATNAPWHLDPAFRRPGRFDRILFVPPPDKAARIKILEIMLKGKPTEKLNLDKLAAKLKDYSGADLKAIIDMATEEKLKQAMKSGKIEPITGQDLAAAAKQVRTSTRDWFSSARNYALYSNESGLYDDILVYLKDGKLI